MSITITIQTSDGIELPPLTPAQAKEVYGLLAEIVEESRLHPAPQAPAVLLPWCPAPPHKISTDRSGTVPIPGVVITTGGSAIQTGGCASTGTQADYSRVTLTEN